MNWADLEVAVVYFKYCRRIFVEKLKKKNIQNLRVGGMSTEVRKANLLSEVATLPCSSSIGAET